MIGVDRQRVNVMYWKWPFVVVVLAAIVSATMFAAPAGAANWLTYHNDRYGTTIDYPDQFTAEPPPDSNDGQRFKSADGAKFAVYAYYNTLDFNVAKFRDSTLKNLAAGQVVTYQASGDNWFVISGTDVANVFYERGLLSHGGQMTEGFSMFYPSAVKQSYDAIVARMGKSFRAGKGYQSP
jgi:hypothetical protein